MLFYGWQDFPSILERITTMNILVMIVYKLREMNSSIETISRYIPGKPYSHIFTKCRTKMSKIHNASETHNATRLWTKKRFQPKPLVHLCWDFCETIAPRCCGGMNDKYSTMLQMHNMHCNCTDKSNLTRWTLLSSWVLISNLWAWGKF